jgi:hypothetical protein
LFCVSWDYRVEIASGFTIQQTEPYEEAVGGEEGRGLEGVFVEKSHGLGLA